MFTDKQRYDQFPACSVLIRFPARQFCALAVVWAAVAVWAKNDPKGEPLSPVPPAQQQHQQSGNRSGHLESSPEQRVRDCQAALKTVATGLEMYASDHQGRYPKSLSELVPTYLPAPAICPAAGWDTYGPGYKTGRSAPYNDKDFEDFYHLACSGGHHAEAGLEKDLPAINGRLGLMPDLPFLGNPEQAQEACGKNLTLIATALEMYSMDHQGRYPGSLSMLQADYLPKIPLCPANNTATYTLTTGVSAPRNPGDYKDYYYLECGGGHVGSDPPVGPCYTSVQGLVDRRK